MFIIIIRLHGSFHQTGHCEWAFTLLDDMVLKYMDHYKHVRTAFIEN